MPTERNFPEHFKAMAPNYARSTGNSTRTIFAKCLGEIESMRPITKDSVIHDGAAGPGTAASTIVEKFSSEHVPEMLVTDYVKPMVDGAKASLGSWPQIQCKVLDSHNLDGVPDNRFTHSIISFSIFAFDDPPKAMKEVYRTLQPGGVSAVLTWERFGAGNVIQAAQALLRPGLPPMPVPRPEFIKEGVLRQTVIDAGFREENVRVLQVGSLVNGTDLEDGLRGFLAGDFTLPAREGCTDEEASRWPEVLGQAIDEELKNYGGVKFDAWVVLAMK